MVVYGSVRQREVESGIDRGVYITTRRGFVLAFTALGIAIGVATLLLVVVEA
jgi:hypothetical protein